MASWLFDELKDYMEFMDERDPKQEYIASNGKKYKLSKINGGTCRFENLDYGKPEFHLAFLRLDSYRECKAHIEKAIKEYEDQKANNEKAEKEREKAEKEREKAEKEREKAELESQELYRQRNIAIAQKREKLQQEFEKANCKQNFAETSDMEWLLSLTEKKVIQQCRRPECHGCKLGWICPKFWSK